MIIHISRERFDRIKSQGWRLITQPDTPISPRMRDTEFHLLDDDSAPCEACGNQFDSVIVDTPAELETLKYTLARLQSMTEIVTNATDFHL